MPRVGSSNTIPILFIFTPETGREIVDVCFRGVNRMLLKVAIVGSF